MERVTAAYILIAAMIAAFAGWAAFRWYHARDRTVRRDRARETSERNKRLSDRASSDETS